jgi:hypothetical protein
MNDYKTMTPEQLRQALEMAELMYVRMVTQFSIAHVGQVDQHSERQLRDAISLRDAAQENARRVFFQVVTGKQWW